MFVPGCPAGHAVDERGVLVTITPGSQRLYSWLRGVAMVMSEPVPAPLVEGPGHEEGDA